MRDDILEYLRNEIYSRCEKPANKFGMGCYYHIEAVVKIVCCFSGAMKISGQIGSQSVQTV